MGLVVDVKDGLDQADRVAEEVEGGAEGLFPRPTARVFANV